jgi:para-nitrobenzyl esterase
VSPRRRLWRLSHVLALSLTFGVSSSAASVSAPRVTLESGVVAGTEQDGVRTFLGIPYAAPPVGNLRWKPPQPVRRWKGVRQATEFRPACAQNGGFGVFASRSENEDCLTLNVFTPRETRGSLRPVMVWIHGGAHYSGNAADYDGSALARDEDLVVVTINYRLGIFGFFFHPSLEAEHSEGGNYGLLDQRFALEWIQRNIRAFGGDPNNVTVFGQSAGGSSILAALAAPSFKNLFHRAAIQSGGRLITTPLANAQAKALEFSAKVGCPGSDVACLRKLPATRILEAQTPYLSGVTLDGRLLTKPIGIALEEGTFNRVPLIVGITKDEQAFSLAARELEKGPQTSEGYREDVEAYYGREHAAAILQAYPVGFLSPSEAEIRAWHGSRACIARWIGNAVSKWTPTFVYEFTDDTAPSYFPPMSFDMGAYHTAELQYLFPLYRGSTGIAKPLNAAQSALAQTMRKYWGNFARTGNPNSASVHEWPAYSETDTVLGIGLETSAIPHYGALRNCYFWDRIHKYR